MLNFLYHYFYYILFLPNFYKKKNWIIFYISGMISLAESISHCFRYFVFSIVLIPSRYFLYGNWMPVFSPAGFHFLSVGDTVSPPTTDVTWILQFIPQPKEVGEFLFFIMIIKPKTWIFSFLLSVMAETFSINMEKDGS